MYKIERRGAGDFLSEGHCSTGGSLRDWEKTPTFTSTLSRKTRRSSVEGGGASGEARARPKGDLCLTLGGKGKKVRKSEKNSGKWGNP